MADQSWMQTQYWHLDYLLSIIYDNSWNFMFKTKVNKQVYYFACLENGALKDIDGIFRDILLNINYYFIIELELKMPSKYTYE